ncbi:MAG: hypothetical protein WCW14_00670 [Candidatus Paceibacterota bacterium]
MKIFRVLGFGLAIIIVRSVMPDVFHAIEQTLLAFFSTLQVVLTSGSNSLAGGGNLASPIANLHLLPL